VHLFNERFPKDNHQHFHRSLSHAWIELSPNFRISAGNRSILGEASSNTNQRLFSIRQDGPMDLQEPESRLDKG
jgi:hypothetical protein